MHFLLFLIQLLAISSDLNIDALTNFPHPSKPDPTC